MEWQALSDLLNFLEDVRDFDREVLIDATFLVCARQKSLNQLAIWIKADDDVNPVSIEIFDDAYGILTAVGIEQDALTIFSEESDRVSQEFVNFDEEDGMGLYEVDFPTEDADVEEWIQSISTDLKNALAEFEPADKFEEILKEFCSMGLGSEN